MMVTQKQLVKFSMEVDSNGGKVTPGMAFRHPKKTAAYITKILKQKNEEIKTLGGDLKTAQKERDAFGRERDKYKGIVETAEQRRATARNIASAIEQIPAAALGDYETKMNQAFTNASRGELTLSMERVDPDKLQEIFWNAAGEPHNKGKLKLHTISGQQYGANLDTAILSKIYYMNADVLPGFVRAVSHAISTHAEGEVSISVRDLKLDNGGKLELEFSWGCASMLPDYMGALKEAAAVFGVEISYDRRSARVSVPYEK